VNVSLITVAVEISRNVTYVKFRRVENS